MKILIVDDSTTLRRILRTQLSALGITQMIEAKTGEECLKLLEENMPVDFITLDINMPVMDGMTCLRKIREQQKYANVKIIMITSESEKSKIIEAIGAGADNYVVKPFSPEIIKKKLGL